MEIYGVWRITDTSVDVEGHGEWPRLVALRDIEDGSTLLITHIKRIRPNAWRLFTPFLRPDHNYELVLHNRGFFVEFSEAYWGRFHFKGWLGVKQKKHSTVFRLFAPRAQRVILSLFEHPYHETEPSLLYQGEIQIEMKRKTAGVWEGRVEKECTGYYYGYRVFGPKGPGELFHPEYILADPYAPALVSFVGYPQRHLGIILKDSYQWKTPHLRLPKSHEWIIYECHLRDMTMLSEGCQQRGTYRGFVEPNQKGGIAHLKELGVRAVEFLPLQEFCEIEPPFGVKGHTPFYNDFNPYSRNHWGYMTTGFFAPESYYGTGSLHPNTWNGLQGHHVRDMKAMVDALHEAGIAVIMDVVYNHVSLYDINALRFIDRRYYFWTSHGQDDSRTGCGNDFRSDRPMARRLIVDSLIHWVKEYHIDGFRFDLGTVIDWKTYRLLSSRLRRMKKGIFLTAEPWHGGRGHDRDGGEYCLLPGKNGFAALGISAWNDRFRNLIRGGTHAVEHPTYGLVFGKVSPEEVWHAIQGYPEIFSRPELSVNYIESHDNHTFTDFLRLGNGDIKPDTEYKPEELLAASLLTPKQLDQAKLAALVLFLSPGVIMIHEGQEFGRMRIVHPPDGSFSLLGNVHWHKNAHGEWVTHHHHWPKHKAKPYTVDGDGYEKDNPTNWINWQLKEVNRPLYDFYRSLIEFRRQHSWIGKLRAPNLFRIDPVEGGGFGWGMKYQKTTLFTLINFSSETTSFAFEKTLRVLFATHPEEMSGEEKKISLAPLRGVVVTPF
ncbi:MAG: alpha-amylase family glycosyl hydrolase [Brevinematales bacterium]|nr:alpha-amylase family glycosyl hydrolase [Brevinematales bacterium]